MKNFYFFAAAALGLASCTSEEAILDPQPPQEIAFNAVAKNSSRKAVESASNWVAPIHVAAAAKSTGATHYSNHFTPNTFVTFRPTTGVWYVEGSTKYYYLPNGKIDFLAYASGGEETSPSNEVEPEASVEKNSDGRFTGMTLNYKNSGHQLSGKTDVMYALTPDFECPLTTTNPTLTFKHALSWLSVRIVDANNTIKISSVKVKNAYLTGSVTVPVNYDGNNPTLGNPTWDVAGVDAASEIEFPAYCPATPTPVTNLGQTEGILIVPQPQTKITVEYELSHSPGNLITQDFILSGYDPWVANKHYTYVISFTNLNEITFTCTIGAYDQAQETSLPLTN